MSNKLILLSALIGMGLATQTNAQEQITTRTKKDIRMLGKQASKHVLNMQHLGAQALQKGESPLSIERRIIKQETLEGNFVSTEFKYGYAGSNYGQQFHNSFFIGFPYNINATNVNEIFMNLNAISFDDVNFALYHPNSSGTNVMADTITIISEGTEVIKNHVTRGSNLNVNSWLNISDEGNGLEYSKQENIYNTGGKVEKINSYYGMDLSNLELESVRKITYNATNDKIVTDTIEYIAGGTIDFTESFDYTYDANGKLIKIKYIDSDFPNDSSILNVTYFTNGNFQKLNAKAYESGVEMPYTYTDSLTYQTGTNLASRSIIMNLMGDIQGYTFKLTYNTNNNLDTVKNYAVENGGEQLNLLAKYHYSTDNNPDSLTAFNPVLPTQELGKMKFYYENFNTSAINKVTRNNNFEVFPVPLNGNSFNLNSKIALKDKNATITLMNINGSKIFSTTQTLKNGLNTINIPTNLAAGNYIVEVVADHSVFTQKISKL